MLERQQIMIAAERLMRMSMREYVLRAHVSVSGPSDLGEVGLGECR